MLDNPNTGRGGRSTGAAATSPGATSSSFGNECSNKRSCVNMRRNNTLPSLGTFRRRSTLLLSPPTTVKQKPSKAQQTCVQSNEFMSKSTPTPVVTSRSATSVQTPASTSTSTTPIVTSGTGDCSTKTSSFPYNAKTELLQSSLSSSITSSSSSYFGGAGGKNVVQVAAMIPTIHAYAPAHIHQQYNHSQKEDIQHGKSTPSYSRYSLSVVSRRLNKSNPYIGSFRHAPPTTFRDLRFQLSPTLSYSDTHTFLNSSDSTGSIQKINHRHSLTFNSTSSSYFSTESSSNNHDEPVSDIQLDINSFPSWHASAESVDLKALQSRLFCTPPLCCLSIHDYDSTKSKSKLSYLSTTNMKTSPTNVSGRLRGGSPFYTKETRTGDDSTGVFENVTIKLVSGLASLLLHLDNTLPFMSDEHVVMRRVRSDSEPVEHSSIVARQFCDLSDCESSVSGTSQDHNNTIHNQDSDDSSCSESVLSDDLNSMESSYDNYDTAHGSRTIPPDVTQFGASSALTSSQSCYFQKSILNKLDASSRHLPTPTGMTIQDGNSNVNRTATQCTTTLASDSTRTDYDTITQMDIIRIARAASRHLDVTSLYQLPTITYCKRTSTLPELPSSINEQEARQGVNDDDHNDTIQVSSSSVKMTPLQNDVEFSWMMIDTEPSDENSVESSIPSDSSKIGLKITTTRATSSDDESVDNGNESKLDICVICFEQFNDGDRLRVLPCSHSFHVGCIDRWLSGAHSFHDCYTAGCPTCKKHPSYSNLPVSSSAFAVGQLHHTAFGGNKVTNNKSSQKSGRRITVTDSTNTNNDKSNRHVVTNLYDSTDGSVPSWSFTRIGNALMRET